VASRLSGWGEVWLFGRLAIVDGFAVFFKVLVGLATVAVLWLSLEAGEIREQDEGRYCALVLAAALGLCLMASAASLLTAYVSIELSSLAARAAMGVRRSGSSFEPPLADVIYGAAASMAMIAGMSWISGFAGSMDYARINQAIFQFAPAGPPVAPVAGALVLGGFGYKVATVVFADGATDERRGGAPTPIVAFVAVAFAAASFALWIRLFYPTLSRPQAGGAWIGPDGLPWRSVVAGLSISAMAAGSLAALVQRDMKRLLGWSSLAHVGTLSMGFVLLDDDALQAMLFYLAAYSVANLGAFGVAASIAGATGRDDIDAYRGLARRRGLASATAATMTIFLVSLAGLPPCVGFLAKLHLGAPVIDREWSVLGAVFLASSVISLFAYGRVVHRMFVRAGEGSEAALTVSRYNGFLVAILAAVTLLFGVYEPPLGDLARRSIHFVQW